MSNKVKFSLNIGLDGGAAIIQSMAKPAVDTAAERIADRANRISMSLRNHPQKFEVTEQTIGIPNRRGGVRYYAKIEGVNHNNSSNQYYQDYQTLHLALDAGRMNRLV